MPEEELAFWAKEIALGAITVVVGLVIVIWRSMVKRMDDTVHRVSECIKRGEYDDAIGDIRNRLRSMEQGINNIYVLLINDRKNATHDRRAGDKPDGGE